MTMNISTREAERGVLGSMLRDNYSIPDIVPLVQAEDFYHDAHQKIYRVAVNLWEKGKPADTVTIADELHKAGHVEDIGGYGYLNELWDAIPTAAHGVHYAGIVREHSVFRRLVAAGNEIMLDAGNPAGPADESLERAERLVFEIASLGLAGSSVQLEDCVSLALDRFDRRQHGETADGVLTGFVDLDRVTCGFQNGELTILAARPSTGKTALALGIARNIVEAGEPVLFVSLEMGRADLAERLLACQGRIDSYRIRHGYLNEEERGKLADAVKALRSLPLHIDDNPHQTVLRIAANARRLQMRKGIKLVVVDYLQLITPDDRKVNREQQIANISARLKHLARECKIPVLALAQLNREVEHRRGERPRLSDLRDSGSLEQDADTVMLMHRPEMNEGVVEVIIAKQRNGPIGDVSLMFMKQFMRFENFAVADTFSSEPFAYSRNGHSGNGHANGAEAPHWMDR